MQTKENKQRSRPSFPARVALYEGTWEKYVPNIGYDLDGDGNNTGAGTVKPEGYPSVTDLLTLAKDMSKKLLKKLKPELTSSGMNATH